MVRIEFETDNASFQDGDGLLDLWVVAGVIRIVAGQIEYGLISGPVRNSNGKTVGKYVVE